MPITPRELSAEQLRRLCSPDDLSFQSTAELELLDDIIGQERATRAIEFGLDIPYYGYNIFALGPSGAGKTTTITQYLERKAATLPIPNDWAYVNDFERPDEPKALRLPPGGGAKLRDRFDQLLDELEELLPKAFESENYEQHRKEMVQELDERRQRVVEAMEASARSQGFAIIETPTGLLFAPLIDGKAATREQFEQLPEEQRNALEAAEPALVEQHRLHRGQVCAVSYADLDIHSADRVLAQHHDL